MKSKPIPRNPQISPAAALAQLLAENPELPPIHWTLGADGHLSGSAMRLTVDAHAVIAAYARVLGGTPDQHWYTPTDGEAKFSSCLFTTWRDVQVSVSVGCAAALAQQVSAVAA